MFGVVIKRWKITSLKTLLRIMMSKIRMRHLQMIQDSAQMKKDTMRHLQLVQDSAQMMNVFYLTKFLRCKKKLTSYNRSIQDHHQCRSMKHQTSIEELHFVVVIQMSFLKFRWRIPTEGQENRKFNANIVNSTCKAGV